MSYFELYFTPKSFSELKRKECTNRKIWALDKLYVFLTIKSVAQVVEWTSRYYSITV